MIFLCSSRTDIHHTVFFMIVEDSIVFFSYAYNQCKDGILRDFDELKVDRIYSEAFDTPRMGQAIMNRLMKSAGHQVISLGEKKDEKV